MNLLDQLSEMPSVDAAATADKLDLILGRARETGIPTTLTSDGKPVAVIMSWDTFEQLESAAAGLRHAEHQLRGCRFGPVKPAEGIDCGCRTADEVAAETSPEEE
ncbi:type II toxin-antitoxin system prevent-host-death family antitoxin [Streptomyces sp. CAU 1734]|uniref:type II toxin-antitoxin system prevent-host-death family antitoxin n=1 Tax=Streptomyces sp. CAU 1734 TaxID=3140360 RepID=UPI003260C166